MCLAEGKLNSTLIPNSPSSNLSSLCASPDCCNKKQRRHTQVARNWISRRTVRSFFWASLLRNATIKSSLADANEFCIDAAASARAFCNMPCRCRQSKQSRKVEEKKMQRGSWGSWNARHSARSLARAVCKNIKNALGERILNHSTCSGDAAPRGHELHALNFSSNSLLT